MWWHDGGGRARELLGRNALYDDSYDNALAESFNGLYKWELINRQGPWRGLDDVEFATMTYVDWFNNKRLLGNITDGPGYTTPAASEAAYYRQNTPAPEPATQ